MSAFSVSTSASQSADGLTVTFTDGSNYTDNTEGYVKSDFTTNTIVITDANGEVLQTSDFLTSDTVEYTQTEDTWFTTTRTLAGIADYTKVQKFPLKRITINKLEDALSMGCCQSKGNSDNLCKADTFIAGADYSEITGNAVKWQNNIDAANAYLDLILD